MRHPAITTARKMACNYLDLYYFPREVFSKSITREHSEIRQFCIAWVVSSNTMPNHELSKVFGFERVHCVTRSAKRAHDRFGSDPRFVGLMDAARVWGENHKRKVCDKAQLLKDREESQWRFSNGSGWWLNDREAA